MELLDEWREGVSMHRGQSMAMHFSVGCLSGVFLKASNPPFRGGTSVSPPWDREVKPM